MHDDGTWGSARRSVERMKKWPWKPEMRRPLLHRILITASHPDGTAESCHPIHSPTDTQKIITSGAGEVVRQLARQLEAVPIPVKGGVVIQLATGEFGQRA